ncbi:MAG: hypothetical protein LBF24_01795 [Puniceicoccales bacterium]|nr:hypothetical protein [Puniceicoccales bacterium]
MGDSCVLLGNDGDGKIRFVRADIPPAVALAHELGHFLYATQTPAGPGSLFARMMAVAQSVYRDVVVGQNGVAAGPLANMDTYDANTTAQKAFLDMWKANNALEFVNILPVDRIIPPPAGGGLPFAPGDGVFYREAYNAGAGGNPRLAVTFFDLFSNVPLTPSPPIPVAKYFIRLSHLDVAAFRSLFSDLWWCQRDELLHIISSLIAKIRIPAGGGMMAVGNLPQFTPPPRRSVCAVA